MTESNGPSRALPESAHEPDIQSVLAAIVESTDDAIYSKDDDAKVTSWNRSAERLYGYTAAEIVGQDIATIIPDDRRGEERIILRRIMNGEKVDHYDTQRLRKDGSLAEVSITVSPVRDVDGQVVGASVIARDITERKRAEELVREGEKRDFIARAAHELKNPLTTIAGMTQVLRDNEDRLSADEKEKVYTSLLRQSERANRLITDLLELARLDSGQIDIEVTDVDVHEVIQTSIEAAALPEGTSVDNQCTPGTRARADAFRLEEVFVNLFSNSAKYGASNVTVACDDLIRITVADDGPGVPAEVQPDLFEPFTRGASIGVPGSGLGLSIARRLCQAFGGTIDFEPNEPTGAKFLITLHPA